MLVKSVFVQLQSHLIMVNTWNLSILEDVASAFMGSGNHRSQQEEAMMALYSSTALVIKLVASARLGQVTSR
jgi:hypothetical protein